MTSDETLAKLCRWFQRCGLRPMLPKRSMAAVFAA